MLNDMKSAKQMGSYIGKTAKEVNEILKKKGYLSGKPGDYDMTAKGKKHGKESLHDNGYGGNAARSWSFYMWDREVFQDISGMKYPDIDWFCDACEDRLNKQPKFTDKKGKWKCTKCGHINIIDDDQIRDN